MIPFSATPEFLVGDIGVYRVKRWLQDQGAFVFSTCDLSGRVDEHAPAMASRAERVILPDLDVTYAQHARVWAEVKTKTIATFTRRTQRLEHGIGLRHWLAYNRIQEITNNQVFLYIYQRDESIILGSAIDDLKTPDFRRSSMPDPRTGRREAMCFFPYAAFRLRAELPVDIDEPAIFSVQLALRFTQQ